MDINRDEVRRQLRESQREHDAVMPRFRSVLARVFDPASKVPPADRARLLSLDSVPSRRALLGGGITVAGAAVLSACTEPPKKEQLALTGTVPDSKTTTTLDPMVVAMEAQKLDLNLLRTAQSLEALAIVVYEMAISSGKVTTPDIVSAAKLFQSQHQDHRGALVAQIGQVGGVPYRNDNAGEVPAGVSADLWAQVNPGLWTSDVEPKLQDASTLTQDDIVKLATSLEDVAAETYTKLGGALSSPELRAFVMSIGGIEARHVAVLLGVTSPDDPRQQAPFAFEKTGNAVAEDDWVGTGPITKEASTTTTTSKPSGTTASSGPATTERSGSATTAGTG
ncbi:MAG: ferritin-like domain-containing protein [Actinobacteria bacterium]|nr:ferritin-like domain-containing protein [Actinomycetota bacterium]